MAAPIIQSPKQAAVALLREQGMRMTPQRLAIVDDIMATSGYVIPVQVIERVQARVPGVSPSTVYRTLERLEGVGVLKHVHLDSGVGYHRVGDVQHAHLYCGRCRTDLELSREALERLRGVVEEDYGFQPDFTHYAISGLCATCRGHGQDGHTHPGERPAESLPQP